MSSYNPIVFPIMAAGCRPYILAELCPVLVCTSPRILSNLAHGSSENLQDPFDGGLFVFNQGGALSLGA